MNNFIHSKREVNGVIISCLISTASIFGSKIGQTKEEIISNILRGISYYTFYNGRVGSLVRVVDGRYLRSDSNNISQDNLDNLPNY